jgi:hypothetical protein
LSAAFVSTRGSCTRPDAAVNQPSGPAAGWGCHLYRPSSCLSGCSRRRGTHLIAEVQGKPRPMPRHGRSEVEGRGEEKAPSAGTTRPSSCCCGTKQYKGVYCRVPGFIRWSLRTAVQTRSLRIRRDFECAGAPVADGVDAGGPHQRAWSPTHARLWPLHPRQDPLLQAQAFEAIAVSQMEKTARHIHPSAI